MGSNPKLSALARYLFTKLKISGAFLIAKDGEVISEGYCGTSNPETRAQIGPETKFNIGSLMKQFTGYELIQKIAAVDLGHEPGTQFEYSNLAYTLLGVVVSRIDQRSCLVSIFPALELLHDPGSRRHRFNRWGSSSVE